MAKEMAIARVIMNKPMFKEFAIFDTFRLKKAWRKPAAMAFAFLALAVFIYITRVRAGAPYQISLAMVGVAMLLPCFYIYRYLKQVNNASAPLEGRHTYSLGVSKTGLDVTPPEDSEAKAASFKWNKITAVHRLKKSIALYTDINHAFLFPRENEEEASLAWEIIIKHMEKDKVHDHN